MGSSVHWSWLAAISLLCLGGEVRGNCTAVNIQMDGGTYQLTKGLEKGTTVVYYCPEGYYPYPALIRHCQSDGKWSPAPKTFQPQRCKLVECPDPRVMENGDVLPPEDKYFVHNETTYECYSGYTLRGSSRRVCLPSGKWSGSTPICSRDTRDTCADPGIPAGATRTGTIFDIGDTVKYSCKDNLLLVGSSERVCQENGQWTGIEPSCYFKHTYDTSLEVTEAFGSAMKTSLTILESVDDIQGTKTIRIPKNGTLNIYIAVDISDSISEENITDAKNAISELITKISSFSVSPNYEIIFFSSQIQEVVDIIDFLDEKISLDTIKKKLDAFPCIRGMGTDLNLVFQTFEKKMAFMQIRVGLETFKKHHHVIILFTDGGFNMGGSPLSTVKQIQNRIYMKDAAGDEDREEYLDIYVFGIGVELFDENLKALALGKGGRHYFRMKEIKSLQETFDEIIDETEVQGLCGLHRDYDTGDKASTRKRYPWMANIVITTVDGKMKCFGSLVTPKFVLTAAHCLPFGTEAKDIFVEIDDEQGRVKKVDTFYVHPQYNVTAKTAEGVKEFYDYDVALIQLMEPVKISSAVRPICIPCTKDTSNALRLYGSSTCAQQEQRLMRNHKENLSFLTRSGSDKKIMEKDVIAKLGDFRDDCISKALLAPGMKTKNASIPVTDSFLCTGGSRDHIACTGDSGGAVFKNYEQHRTIQIALVSWGTHNLCGDGGLVESHPDSRDFHINLFKMTPFLKSILGQDTDDYAPLVFLDN